LAALLQQRAEPADGLWARRVGRPGADSRRQDRRMSRGGHNGAATSAGLRTLSCCWSREPRTWRPARSAGVGRLCHHVRYVWPGPPRHGPSYAGGVGVALAVGVDVL